MTNPSPEFTTHPQGALLSRCCGALMQGFGPVVQCVVCKQDAAVWNEERSGWDPPPGSAAKHTRTIPPTRVGTMPDPTMPPSEPVAETPVRVRVPVQDSREWGKPDGSIEWWEHVEAWTRGYGYNQSAARIAERGGFSYAEVVYSLGHEPTTWKAGRVRWQSGIDPGPKSWREDSAARAFYAANLAHLRPDGKQPADNAHTGGAS